jgi:phytoene synthase
MADLDASYRSAEKITRNRARNFYYSFIVLPPAKRRALCAIYAFLRHCDDIADDPAPVDRKRERLRVWRAQLNEPPPQETDECVFLPAFQDTVQRYEISTRYFHCVIDGAEMDLTTDQFVTFEDLYRYCFNVASAVGLVVLQIFGYVDERAKLYAEHCGIAFQLTNILRDLKEDAGLGRIYLPREELGQFQYSPDDLRRGIVDERFHRLMTYQSTRAQRYYTNARNLLPLVEEASRPALWAMMEIYGRILSKIIRSSYNVFEQKIGLSRSEKFAIALRALTMRLIPGRIGTE